MYVYIYMEKESHGDLGGVISSATAQVCYTAYICI